MKAGWKTVKLGEVADIYNGNTIPDKEKKRLLELPNPGLPFIATKDVGFDGVVDYENGINIPKDEALDFKVAKADAVLVCAEGGSAGRKIGHINRDVHFGNKLFALNATQAINPRYLYHFCQSEDFRKKFKALMAGLIGGVSVAKFKLIEIPLPPLVEQERIVALLDEAFAGIDAAKAKAEASIKRNADLFKSLLQSSFASQDPEWVEMTLENCCEQIFAGGDVPKGRLSDERTTEFNVPIYANGEKDAGLYGFTDIARVTKPSITVSARGTLGFTAIRTEPFFPIVRLIVLVPDEKKISLQFLYHAITGMDFGNTGTSIPQLTVPNFKESRLRIPGLQTQNAIAGKIDTIRKNGQSLRRLHEQKVLMLNELKNSLLSQAFAGELTA